MLQVEYLLHRSDLAKMQKILSVPLLRILLRQGQVLHPIGDAWLDHCTFIPFIKTRYSNPIWMAGDSRVPTDAVRCAIVARDNVCSYAAGNACIVIAWYHACRPDLIGLVGAIVGVDLVAEALIHRRHIAVLNTPVAAAEQMDAVKNAQHVGVYTFGRPDHLIIWISLAADIGPLRYRAPVAKWVPEEDNRFALPVEEVWVVAIV